MRLKTTRSGSGAGSYNIKWTIWHVNYGNGSNASESKSDLAGNPDLNTSGYGWQIFNAVLGWNNTGTYGSTLSYIFYWLAVTMALIFMRLRETRGENGSETSIRGLWRVRGSTKSRSLPTASSHSGSSSSEKGKGASVTIEKIPSSAAIEVN